MGKFLCKYHGTSGMVFICPHIRDDIRVRVKSKRIIRAVFPDTSDIEDRFKVNFKLHYCLDCATEYDFPMKDSEIHDKKFDSMYEKKFSPNCYQCFKELNN